MNPNNVVVPKIRLSEPNLDQHEIANITTAISENNLTFGIYQKLFSEKLTDYLGVSNVILTNSGTSSLHMLYKYVGISKDNLVIIPDITFAGTVFPVIYLGANPTFIDVSTDDYNINLEVLESFLSNKRKKFKGKIWLIAVDIFGFPNRYADLLSLSSKYDVKLILDAAESLGSKFNGKVPGNYIDNLATSFNGNKIITSSGGGAIGCNDAKMFEKISYWINQSKSALESYHHEEIGYNYRLSNVHAAIGYAQILKIDEFIEKRRMIRNFYNTFFKENNLGITVLMDSNEQTSNAWLTVIKFTGENCENTRDKVKNTLDHAGIETRLIWKPMSCQPVFKKYESITNQFSIKAFHQSLCLPSHPGLSINDLELVVTKIEESLKL